jgi:hypothetical protein
VKQQQLVEFKVAREPLSPSPHYPISGSAIVSLLTQSNTYEESF